MSEIYSSELKQMLSQAEARRNAHSRQNSRFSPTEIRSGTFPYPFELPNDLNVKEMALGEYRCRWLFHPAWDAKRRIVYFHGGGYVGGGWDSYKGIGAWLSWYSRTPVLFVEYRLAPEHRYPIATEDAYAALQWAYNNGPEGTSQAASVCTAGDSAGGGLAVIVAMMARDRGARLPSACICAGPFFDLASDSSTYLKGDSTRVQMVDCYIDQMHARQEYASPLHGDLHGLPPIHIQVGSADILLHDSLAFADKAARSNVEVALQIAPYMPHVWQRFVPFAPESVIAV